MKLVWRTLFRLPGPLGPAKDALVDEVLSHLALIVGAPEDVGLQALDNVPRAPGPCSASDGQAPPSAMAP